ncbi:protein FAM136A-like [Camellia sinensis]|uniref:protein FAM136A-like n=1 Tax=Camellia sinensis TaxID=4442 RepID=UPI0010366457|nr:protein FAM136A-like [Camellia sinensis]XP_028081178.1 protein FAM136A-like [Camellia sinensis]
MQRHRCLQKPPNSFLVERERKTVREREREREMDHIAAAEEQIATERFRRKLNEVTTAAETQLSGVQDHVNFTLQQAYFRCAYECFDRRRTQDEINNCVENCSVPVLKAQNLVETEMAKFQERLNRSLMVCQDKFDAAKTQQIGSDALKGLESCVDQSVQDSIKTLPHIVGRLKASLSISE